MNIQSIYNAYKTSKKKREAIEMATTKKHEATESMTKFEEQLKTVQDKIIDIKKSNGELQKMVDEINALDVPQEAWEKKFDKSWAETYKEALKVISANHSNINLLEKVKEELFEVIRQYENTIKMCDDALLLLI